MDSFLKYINKFSRADFYWFVFCLLTIPTAILTRFLGLSNPFWDVHPLRQAQTAMTIRYMAKNLSGFFDYSSPFNGLLWNYIREFPLYQWMVSLLVEAGVDITVASRTSTLTVFLISIPFLFGFLKRLSGREVARWGCLFYFVLPFSILYSRVCQVDMVSVSCLIIGSHYGLGYLESRKRVHWLAGTLFLALSGLIKVTIWFAPIGFFGIFYFFKAIKDQHFRKNTLVFLSLIVQLAVVGAWSLWAEHAYYRTGNFPGQVWLFGDWGIRSDPANYIHLMKTFIQFVLSGWLLVPLLIGIYSMRRKRTELAHILLASATPIFVFFNVSIFHDYYFLACLLPLLFLCGKGMNEIFKFPMKIQWALFSMIFILYANAQRSLIGSAQNTFSLRVENENHYDRIKSLFDPSDIVWPDEFNDSVLYAYHSERTFALIKSTPIEKIRPTALYLQSESTLLKDYIKKAEQLSVLEKIGGTYIYRLKDVGAKKFDPRKHVGVIRESKQFPEHVLNSPEPLSLNACSGAKGYELVKNTSGSGNVLSVYFESTQTEFIVPGGNYLSIPAMSPWGCKVVIKARLPIAQVGTLLADLPLKLPNQKQSFRH